MSRCPVCLWSTTTVNVLGQHDLSDPYEAVHSLSHCGHCVMYHCISDTKNFKNLEIITLDNYDIINKLLYQKMTLFMISLQFQINTYVNKGCNLENPYVL